MFRDYAVMDLDVMIPTDLGQGKDLLLSGFHLKG